MKFLHLADLHLGKTLHNVSLIENGDQGYWIDQILALIRRERPEAVVIAGDVYDRAVPAKEAIPLLSRLLTEIARMNTPMMLVAGNHDGGERLEFATELLKDRHVHIAGVVERKMQRVEVDTRDGLGPVTFWLMPYLFPAAARKALDLPEEKIGSYTDAVRELIGAQEIDFSKRNVLVAHQMVCFGEEKPMTSRSETAIGGVGGIDASVLAGFDYVALGHIHQSQRIGSDRIRYAGSPMCYHFSETGQKKGPLMVTLGGKEDLPQTEMKELKPLHTVRPEMRGKLAEILAAEQESEARDEYVRVILTDETVPQGTRETLTALFESHGCRLMDIGREPERVTAPGGVPGARSAAELTLEEHFLSFYRQQSGLEDPTEEELALIRFAADLNCAGDERDEETLAATLAEQALKREEAKRT